MYYLITKKGRVVDFNEDKSFLSDYRAKDFDLIESNILPEDSFFDAPSQYVFSEEKTSVFFKEPSQEEIEEILNYFRPPLPNISLVEIIEAIAELGQRIEENNSKNIIV